MQTSSVRAMAEQATAPTSETIDTPAKLHSNVQHLSPSNINRGFFKLPLELRDQIYDDIATAETQIGLKVTLKDFSSPEVNAYSVKGLGQTLQTDQTRVFRQTPAPYQRPLDRIHSSSNPTRCSLFPLPAPWTT